VRSIFSTEIVHYNCASTLVDVFKILASCSVEAVMPKKQERWWHRTLPHDVKLGDTAIVYTFKNPDTGVEEVIKTWKADRKLGKLLRKIWKLSERDAYVDREDVANLANIIGAIYVQDEKWKKAKKWFKIGLSYSKTSESRGKLKGNLKVLKQRKTINP